MYELTSGARDQTNSVRAILTPMIAAGALHSLAGIDH
jgi:hypothetical protein